MEANHQTLPRVLIWGLRINEIGGNTLPGALLTREGNHAKKLSSCPDSTGTTETLTASAAAGAASAIAAEGMVQAVVRVLATLGVSEDD